MKNVFLVLVFIAAGSISHAQVSKGIKGPKFKNQKAWNKSASVIAVSNTQSESVKGPKAKNNRMYTSTSTTSLGVSNDKRGLKGPKFKNAK